MVYPWFTFPLALGTSALASYGASKLQKRIADRYSSGKMLKRRRNGLLGPSKRMRFSRFSRKRRPRFARGRLRNRIGFRNKFYPRRAFAGSGRFTARKMARAVESKVLAVRNSVANTVTLTNGLVTTTREYLFSPFQSLVQGTGPDQFNGTMIYLKGCLLQFFVTHNTADSYHVQIDCFKEMDDVDRTTFWVQRTDTGDEVTDHFYDRVYGAGSTVTDAENFLAVPNQRGAGPACIFRKRFRSVNFNAGGGNPSRLVSIYLPLNQVVRFKNMPGATLAGAPNYMEHGTPVFVFKFFNSSAADGTQTSLDITGTSARIYFKDP